MTENVPPKKNTGKPYEKLTQRVFQAILKQEGVTTVDVKHDVKVRGTSGYEHQIDVYWQFRHAGMLHTVLVQAKDWSEAVDPGPVNTLAGVLQDVPGARGIIVARAGFTSGAKTLAPSKAIDLLHLREPVDADWEGLIRAIRIDMKLYSPHFQKLSVVPDQAWWKMYREEHKIADDTATYQGSLDHFEREDGSTLITVNKAANAMVPHGMRTFDWEPCRYDFSECAFIPTGNPVVPRMKVLAFIGEVRMDLIEETIEIRADEVVGWILQNVFSGEQRAFDRDVNPIKMFHVTPTDENEKEDE